MDLLLKQLLIDENNNDKSLYSSGDYWVKKNIKTIYHLKNKNLENFRGMNSGVGTSFADNIVINIENEINLLGRLIFNFFKLPFLKHLHKKQVEITKSHAKDHLRSLSILYKNSSKVKELIKKYKFENTVNYGCCQKFSIGGIEYSNLYLEIANRIDNISKFQDFKSFNSFFEIGGGFGANVDFLLTNFPNIKKIIYLDAVPNIYIGTTYLREKYKSSVIDYLQTKELDKLQFSNNNNLEIFCIAPWQIEKLNIKIDHFHNAASFVEMPKHIVKNYLKYIFKNNLKSMSLVSYSLYDPNTTFDPYKLNEFFENKLDSHEFPTAVPDLGRKDIYLIKKNS